MKTRSCLLTGTLILACCFFLVAGIVKGYSPIQAATFFRAPSPQELCDTGNPIVAKLKTYFGQNGSYPGSLNACGITSPTTFFGPWEYRVAADGQSCRLSNGDYGRYLFVVSWTPKNGWYVDT